MPKAKNAKADEAFALYQQGLKLTEIAKRLEIPEGTIRRWKSAYKWSREGSERSEKNHANVRFQNGPEKEAKTNTKKRYQPGAEELNEKQRKFCIFYTRSFNATKAYQKAYKCSYATAMTEGSKTLRNPKIQHEIEILKQNRLNQELLTAPDIFQRYIDIAFADITDFVTFGTEKGTNFVRLNDSEETDGTIVSEIRQAKDSVLVKLNDRMKALDWLSAHMDMATEEQKARVELLRANADRIRSSNKPEEEDGVVIINDAPGENL